MSQRTTARGGRELDQDQRWVQKNPEGYTPSLNLLTPGKTSVKN